MERSIFLDKDGTLIHDVAYNVSLSKIAFYPDIFSSLKQLVTAGYSLILISNQSGIAKGLFNEKELRIALDYIVGYLYQKGISIKGYYYCPHDEQNVCNCRKPLPGLLQKAAYEHRIDLSHSWMIGDILTDVGAGRAAGCKTILLDRNRSERLLPLGYQDPFRPDYILDDFFGVANAVLDAKNKETEIYTNRHTGQ